MTEIPSVFVVDNVNLVHTRWCPTLPEGTTPYMAKPKTALDLLTHLARPDSHERHQGAAAIRPCASCIPALAETERIQLP